DYEIYIEHFALNRNGQAPKGWNDYRNGVEWKRSIHNQHKTTLIETYSWQRSEGILQESLRNELESQGVKFRSVPIKDLLQKLAEWVVTWLARLLVKFLNHVRTNDISADELRKRANSGVTNVRQAAFLRLFEKIRDRYEGALRTDQTLDFYDLINRASDLIRNGRSNKSYRYVLVDEFQDISAGRMGLLRSLSTPDTAYYLVGDDWQSINRFAGSDVSLLRNCGQHLGFTQTRELSQTFRYGKGILDPASQFVRKNPIQTQRVMKPTVAQVDDGISIIASAENENGHQVDGLHIALDDISGRVGTINQSDCNVLVLGRYWFNNPDLPPNGRCHGHLSVRYSTVHSAKGQEADYVIVLGLKSARLGFPCKIEDDPLLQLVMPPSEEGELRFSEERRLFYVALTRARRGAYLIVDPDRPSEFVKELRAEHRLRRYGEISDDLRPACPNCGTGKLKESQSGQNLRCTNFPSCTHLAPCCEYCDDGFTVISGAGESECTNEGCDNPASACPKCRTGVLSQRNGRHGPFWGCTNYWAEPPCEFTLDFASQYS
ncbi:MAG: AAA family ATPase, partial [Chloroflexi bacterium]|nr:AAA family ATPase [Chloroflexota bacterium]